MQNALRQYNILSHRRQEITKRNLNDVLENVKSIWNGALDFYRN